MVCAIEAGYIKCWGYESYPEYGLISTNAPKGGDFVHVSCAPLWTSTCCAVKSDGKLECWGDDRKNQLTNKPTSSDFVQVAVSQCGHICGLKLSGSIECWGEMSYAGIGSYPTHNDIIGLSCSWINCGIVRSNGQVQVWGYNGQEQGGLVSNTPSDTDFKEIAVGANHACALRNSGAIVCWGLDDFGQKSVPPYEDFIAVSSGYRKSCGVRSDNTIECWGLETVKIPNGDDFIAVTSGDGQSCGLHATGEVSCWDGGAVAEGPCIVGIVQ